MTSMSAPSAPGSKSRLLALVTPCTHAKNRIAEKLGGGAVLSTTYGKIFHPAGPDGSPKCLGQPDLRKMALGGLVRSIVSFFHDNADVVCKFSDSLPSSDDEREILVGKCLMSLLSSPRTGAPPSISETTLSLFTVSPNRQNDRYRLLGIVCLGVGDESGTSAVYAHPKRAEIVRLFMELLDDFTLACCLSATQSTSVAPSFATHLSGVIDSAAHNGPPRAQNAAFFTKRLAALQTFSRLLGTEKTLDAMKKSLEPLSRFGEAAGCLTGSLKKDFSSIARLSQLAMAPRVSSAAPRPRLPLRLEPVPEGVYV